MSLKDRLERLEKLLRPRGSSGYARIYFDDSGYFDDRGRPLKLDAVPAASIRLILPRKEQPDLPTA
ncbi:MAG: hypothetical protein ACRESA_09940 [Gammaproteobacteria bacterium]